MSITNKLTGHGRPSNHLRAEVGQFYEDLDTGTPSAVEVS